MSKIELTARCRIWVTGDEGKRKEIKAGESFSIEKDEGLKLVKLKAAAEKGSDEDAVLCRRAAEAQAAEDERRKKIEAEVAAQNAQAAEAAKAAEATKAAEEKAAAEAAEFERLVAEEKAAEEKAAAEAAEAAEAERLAAEEKAKLDALKGDDEEDLIG